MKETRSWPIFWPGALAGLIVTALGYLAHRVGDWLFWPEVAAQWAFALVPGQIQADAISALGADAKVLGLYVAMVVQIVGGGVFALILPQRRWWSRALMVGALTSLVAFLFKLTAPAVQLVWAGPFVLGAVLAGVGYAVAFFWIHSRLAPGQTSPGPRWTRRRWLAGAGTVLGTVVLWPWVRNDLNRAPSAVARTVEPIAPEVVAAFREGTLDFDALPMLPPWLTPEPQFYYVSKNLVPHDISLDEWGALEVGGLVEVPLRMPLENLHAMPNVELYNTLQCIDFDPFSPLTDDLIGNGRWTGVPLRALLERAQVQPQAVDLLLEASDGYSDSVPIRTVLERDDILLVWALNGEPLSAKHGYPLRLIVPGQYGMKNVKHVHRLMAVGEDYQGYWQKRGWVDDAPNKTYAKIESLAFSQSVPLGQPVLIAGWTFAGKRGVSSVEVSLDDGQTWSVAQLEAERSPATWVRWASLWEPTQTGRFKVTARAYDRLGQAQADKRVGSFPSGVTGYHFAWMDVVENDTQGSHSD
ncbi:MAG TPA: molybdopterin-dependent oxidoreductase [Candidatus Bipolaricaulota bacterium]